MPGLFGQILEGETLFDLADESNSEPWQNPLPTMYRQFVQIKAQYSGYVLLFLTGDYYEAFNEDAEALHDVCGVMVTQKTIGGEAVLLAGVPCERIESYLRHMVANGRRVGLCEMVNGHREVIRLMTPGQQTQQTRKAASPPLWKEIAQQVKASGIPHVVVDEAKKALFKGTKLRAFHLVLYTQREGNNWLLLAGRSDKAAREDMRQWQEVFGDGFIAVLAQKRADGIVYRDLAGNELTLDDLCMTPKAARPQEKEPWQMRRAEFMAAYRDRVTVSGNDSYFHPRSGNRVLWPGTRSKDKVLTRQHSIEVRSALMAGKPVPPEVLADYPDDLPE